MPDPDTRAIALQALGTCIDRGLSFAAFRLPGNALHLIVQQHPVVRQADPGEMDDLQKAFLFDAYSEDHEGPFLLEGVHFGGPSLWTAADLERLASEEFEGAHHPGPASPPPMDRSRYDAILQKAISAIASGHLGKVVLSRTIDVPVSGIDLPRFFADLMDVHPKVFVCLLQCPAFGRWMGASPERLVHATRNRIEVDALAGTMAIGSAVKKVEMWGAKERDEQEHVTQGVLSSLKDLGISQVNVSGPEVLNSGAVAHLHSTLTAEIGTVPLMRVVKALHPTAAVCGTPTDAAKDFIRANEGHDRQLYAGYWGPWNFNGETHLFVNIRCLRHFADHVTLFVGGGITAGSDVEHEWQETRHKAETLLAALERSQVDGAQRDPARIP